jgi:hypothetical protein
MMKVPIVADSRNVKEESRDIDMSIFEVDEWKMGK